jgi:hypothetical protein
MSNQCQFIRQTAAVLLACGLVASLLPSSAAAQDASHISPVKGRPDISISRQVSIPGERSLPDMPMTAPPENSLAY